MLYLLEQREGSVTEVGATLFGRKVDTNVSVRVVDQAGHWYVYDVITDGTGIMNNYHAQVASIIRDHSYAGLVSKITERIVAVNAFEATIDP